MSNLDMIVESLGDIRYHSPSTQSADALKRMLESDVLEFSKLVSYLSRELSRFCNIDEHINHIENVDDAATLWLETAAFVREMNTPYRCLTEGPISERFVSFESKLKLVDFLLSELQATHIILADKPQAINSIVSQRSDESEEKKALQRILITLGFPKPPASVTPTEIWTKIEARTKELLAKMPKDYLGKPLFNAMLNQQQWERLAQVNQKMSDDFRLRRELLLTRLDVTIQSFKWADRLKKSNSEISNLYHEKRRTLTAKPGIKIGDLLAARDSLCKQEKTCSSRLMTSSRLHKIIIPKVPDRGGRTCELEPPPPEMPAFAQRSATSSAPQPQGQRFNQGGRGGGGGGGGGRSSNNNWSNTDPSNYRAQSDFERFQNQDYGRGGGRGGGGGGGGGGGRGRGGGGGGGGGGRY